MCLPSPNTDWNGLSRGVGGPGPQPQGAPTPAGPAPVGCLDPVPLQLWGPLGNTGASPLALGSCSPPSPRSQTSGKGSWVHQSLSSHTLLVAKSSRLVLLPLMEAHASSQPSPQVLSTQCKHGPEDPLGALTGLTGSLERHLCGDSPGEARVAQAALALRSPHVPGPRPPRGTVAEAAGGSHHRQSDGWNEASEAELDGPPALRARQATPTSCSCSARPPTCPA